MTSDWTDSETFSSVDAAWLHMDTPSNLAVITGIISFETPPDFKRVKRNFERRLLLVHRRFMQRVSPPSMRLGLPRWELDPDFDINNHLVPYRLPEPADHDTLQDFVGSLMSQPLDPARPLWLFYFIENYAEGAALVCRIHHAVADGLALVQILLSTTDLQADAQEPDYPEPPASENGLLGRLLRPAIKAAAAVGSTWRVAENLVYEGAETLVHPTRLVSAAKAGASVTLALSKLLLIGPDRRTALRGRCDIPKRAVWSTAIDLQQVKAIGQMMGGTVNDILVSALTGALRRYLEERQDPVDGLNIRAVVPVNLRPLDHPELTGNHFGLVFLSLPVGIRDPLRRLVTLRRRMNEIKDTPEALVAFGILGAIGLSPTQIENIIVAIFGMKGSAVVTNVPGPRQPLYFAGSKINSMMFWVPTPGNISLGVSILSYDNKVIVGFAADAGLIPDPEALLRCFIDELEQLERWGRPPHGLPAPVAPGEAGSNGKSPAAASSPQTSDAPPANSPSESAACRAMTKSGAPCKNRPIPGQPFCRVHASLTEAQNSR